MSWVWNVMLSFSDEEYWLEGREDAVEVPPALAEINRWLQLNGGGLTDLTVDSGGVGINANLFGGGFKNLDIQMLIRAVAEQEWRDRESVQLFIKDEDQSKWTIVDLPPAIAQLNSEGCDE